MSVALSKIDVSLLAKLERTISSGLGTFVAVGVALKEIRDRKLYRATHDQFEAYCRERWGMERAHAYRLIDSSSVVKTLSPIGDIPKTESQVRPLVSLSPAKQKKAWAEAVRTAPEGRVTAAHVARVVKQREGPSRTDAITFDGGKVERSLSQLIKIVMQLDSYRATGRLKRFVKSCKNLTAYRSQIAAAQKVLQRLAKEIG